MYGKWRLPKKIEQLTMSENAIIGRYSVALSKKDQVDTKMLSVAESESNINDDTASPQAKSQITEFVKKRAVHNSKGRKEKKQISLSEETKARKPLKKDEQQEHRIKPIFNETEFSSISIHYPSFSKNGLTLDEFKLPYIKEHFKTEMEKMDVDSVLPELLKMKAEYPMLISMIGGNTGRIPYLNLKKARLDDFQFSNCNYGNAVFETLRIETISERHLMIVRGFHMRVSEIIRTARESDHYNDITFVKIFVYNLDLDEQHANYNRYIRFCLF